MKKLFVILAIEFITQCACNKHNAPTEIHAFFEGTRSTVVIPCSMVKNGANDPPRPTTQPFYGFEQRLCILLYITLKDRFISIQDAKFFSFYTDNTNIIYTLTFYTLTFNK